MDYLFIKICFLSACAGWCYVDKLTANRGLFDFIPQYYPKDSFIEKVLRCPHCTAGWLSFFASILVFGVPLYGNSISLIMFLCYIFMAPFPTMAFVNIIKGK